MKPPYLKEKTSRGVEYHFRLRVIKDARQCTADALRRELEIKREKQA